MEPSDPKERFVFRLLRRAKGDLRREGQFMPSMEAVYERAKLMARAVNDA